MLEWDAKKAALDQLEQRRAAAEAVNDEEQGMFVKLAELIVSNLQITVKDVHIRVEDLANGPSPFSLGLEIQTVHVQSCDEHWKPAFIGDATGPLRKEIAIQGLSLHLNDSCVPMVGAESPSAWTTGDWAAAFERSDGGRRQYILQPLTLTTRVVLPRQPSGTFAQPQYTVSCDMGKIGLLLNDAQFRSVLALLTLAGASLGGIGPAGWKCDGDGEMKNGEAGHRQEKLIGDAKGSFISGAGRGCVSCAVRCRQV